MNVYVLQDDEKTVVGVFEYRAAAFQLASDILRPYRQEDFEALMREWTITCVEVT